MNFRSFGNRLFLRIIRPVLVKGYAFFTYKTYDLAFGQVLRGWKPDIIHAHDGVTLPTAARAARDIGAKLVFDSHELEAHRSPPMPMLRRMQVEYMEKTYLPQADRVMAVTELAANYLQHNYGIDRPLVLFNAPPAKPGPAPKRWDVLDRFDVRSDLYLHPKKFLFVYTGNITLNRGLELAVIALSKLQGYRDLNGRFRGDYHLAVIGKVQSGQDEAVRQIAESYGVASKVHLLPPVAPQRVAQYISTANAAIIPILPVTLSYEYAMPNKLFEAMLAGTPIIGADLLEMGPFITDNRLGLTYRADSPDDCVEKMMELIDRYDAFRRTPERQRELEETFAWEAQERKLLAMYQDLMPLSPGSLGAPAITLYAEGRKLLEAGKTDEAIVRIEAAVADKPANADWHAALGAAYAKGGRLEDALAAFREAERRRPEESRFALSCADTLLRLNRVEEARVAFEAIAGKTPTLAAAWTGIGRAAAAAGDAEAASPALKRALDLDPESAATHAALASVAEDAGDREAALVHREKVARLRSEHLPSQVAHARAMIEAEHYAAARDRLEQLNQRTPEDSRIVGPLHLAAGLAPDFVERLRETRPQVRQRVYLTGCGRSGTWMMAAMISGIEGLRMAEGERPVGEFLWMPDLPEIQLVKRQHNAWRFFHLLPPDLKVIHVVRHPWDVLISQHREARHYISIDRMESEHRAFFAHLVDRPNTLVLRYEDVVTDTDQTQSQVETFLGARAIVSFRDFWRNQALPDDVVAAMHGLRPIDQTAIHRWRDDAGEIEYLRTVDQRSDGTIARFAAHFGYDLTLPSPPEETIISQSDR